MISRNVLVIGVVAALAVVAALGLFVSSGFSSIGIGQDRAQMARQTTEQYWRYVNHGKIAQAYKMLTTGNQQAMTPQVYSQNMMDFLTHVNGVIVKAGKPQINGDRAIVPVTMSTPGASGQLHAYQHLFWQNGEWRISDENGGVSHKR